MREDSFAVCKMAAISWSVKVTPISYMVAVVFKTGSDATSKSHNRAPSANKKHQHITVIDEQLINNFMHIGIPASLLLVKERISS